MARRRPEFAMRFGKWTQVYIPPFRARCAACGQTADLGFTGTEYLCRTHLAARGSTPEAEGERLALQQAAGLQQGQGGGVLAPGSCCWRFWEGYRGLAAEPAAPPATAVRPLGEDRRQTARAWD